MDVDPAWNDVGHYEDQDSEPAVCQVIELDEDVAIDEERNHYRVQDLCAAENEDLELWRWLLWRLSSKGI